MKVGDVVHDDLTGKSATVARVFESGPNKWKALELEDKTWLGGLRYAWEVTTQEETYD